MGGSGSMEDEDDTDAPELEPTVIKSKIVEYEAFLENVLKRELKCSLDEYRKDAEVLDQCRQLRKNLDMLQKGSITELETMIDIGCQFFTKAFVPNTSRIFLDVGLGFRLEMTQVEAAEFLIQKEEYILAKLENRKKNTARIKADIHEALHLMDLMMQIQAGGNPWLAGMDESVISTYAD